MALPECFPELKDLIAFKGEEGEKEVEWQFKSSNRLSEAAEELVFLQAGAAEGQQGAVPGQPGAVPGQLAGQAAARGGAGPERRRGLAAPSSRGHLRLLGWAVESQVIAACECPWEHGAGDGREVVIAPVVVLESSKSVPAPLGRGGATLPSSDFPSLLLLPAGW